MGCNFKNRPDSWRRSDPCTYWRPLQKMVKMRQRCTSSFPSSVLFVQKTTKRQKDVPDTFSLHGSLVPWARRGSNTGPLDLQSNALPTEPQTLFWLWNPDWVGLVFIYVFFLVTKSCVACSHKLKVSQEYSQEPVRFPPERHKHGDPATNLSGKVDQVTFITGARSVDKRDFIKNMRFFRVPVSTETRSWDVYV